MTPEQIKSAQDAVSAIAPVIGRYVAALVESGLSRNESIVMAQALQQTVFQTALVLAAPGGKA